MDKRKVKTNDSHSSIVNLRRRRQGGTEVAMLATNFVTLVSHEVEDVAGSHHVRLVDVFP